VVVSTTPTTTSTTTVATTVSSTATRTVAVGGGRTHLGDAVLDVLDAENTIILQSWETYVEVSE
jgi:hypothetical protein